MGQEGALSEWAKLEVQRIVDTTLKRYDTRQESRHRENSEKLAEIVESVSDIKVTIGQASGGKAMVAWGIPLLVAVLTLVAELMKK